MSIAQKNERGGTGEAGGDGEHRAFDAGEFAHFDAEEGGEAGHHDEGIDDHGHDGAADEERCQCAAPFILAGNGHGGAP